MRLHNPGLIRWIFEEAKVRHLARPSYQARQEDGTKFKFMSGVILREVLADILHTTRHCCIAYRLVEYTSKSAAKKLAAARIFQRVRSKLLVVSMFRKMLQTARDEEAQAELMWKQCCGSLSLSSKAFVSGAKSMGLRSFACGSISLSLRRLQKAG